ncbi:MAG: glutamyl-tRNA reductase [Desulfobacteraceae bacterium]|nr:glutamyl-tRNA reductase [Desulfobacteraceae bacterium]
MPEIILIGANHKTASVELRECLAFSDDETIQALGKLKQKGNIREVFLFSTCNRTEVLFIPDGADNINTIKNFLAEFKSIALSKFEDSLYIYKDDDAINHLFNVAASLDSMVIGEPQILGQVKAAFKTATANNSSGVILNRLLHKTFSIAKKVRKETGIGDNAVSISYAAVELAGKIFSDLSTKSVMLIGTGEMAELAVEHLLSNNVEKIIVANRTFENAVNLAEKFRGQAVKFEEMELMLQKVDIVISSTGATQYILTQSQIKDVMRTRKNRPLFFIDIALPRDIDPEVNNINNTYLYDIDDLQNIVDENIGKREKETVKAQRLIEEAVIKFQKWLKDLEVVPTIIAVKEKIEEITEIETEKTLSTMTHLSKKDTEAIKRMTKAIASRVMHDPIRFLKEPGLHRENSFYLNAARQIFDLDLNNNDK